MMTQLEWRIHHDSDDIATRMTLIFWGSASAIAWDKLHRTEFPGEVPMFKIYEQKYYFMLRWMRQIKQGLQQFSDMPVMVRKCLNSAQRYVEAQTHFMDRRQAHELACQLLPMLLSVMDRSTTEGEHHTCRAIVCILSCMSGRMHGGDNMDEFRIVPQTHRPDEIVLLSSQDFTQANEFQFQLGYATRTQEKT